MRNTSKQPDLWAHHGGTEPIRSTNTVSEARLQPSMLTYIPPYT
jgi:hypothetical protein